MNPDPDDAPAYLRIASVLEAEIRGGRHEHGKRLEGEQALARRFDVNRHTIARALNHLQSKGLLYRVKGHGSYVSAGRLVYRVGRYMSFSNSVAQLGLRNSQVVLRIESHTPSERAIEHLALGPGATVVTLRRARHAGKVPLAVLEKDYPEDLFPGLEQHLREGFLSTHQLLRRHYGAEVLRAWTLLEIEPASTELARILGVPVGSALLRAESLDVLRDGTPSGWGIARFRGDATRVRVDTLPNQGR